MKTSNRRFGRIPASAAVTIFSLASAAVAARDGDRQSGLQRVYGDRTQVGQSHLSVYADFQRDDGMEARLVALGVEFKAVMLDTAPDEAPFDWLNCWDINGNGVYDVRHHSTASAEPEECAGGHERVLFFPQQLRDTPIKWMLFNWNPSGHLPHGVYDARHYDFHFYIQDYADRNLIRLGPCAEITNCDDFKVARQPLPPGYTPKDYTDVGAVEGHMGNHLTDLTAPEFQPGGKFTRTFIYGAYGGRLTFLEPMITESYLKSLALRDRASECVAIKRPQKFAEAGLYPTQYCSRYRDGIYTVSLEGMVYRRAF